MLYHTSKSFQLTFLREYPLNYKVIFCIISHYNINVSYWYWSEYDTSFLRNAPTPTECPLCGCTWGQFGEHASDKVNKSKSLFFIQEANIEVCIKDISGACLDPLTFHKDNLCLLLVFLGAQSPFWSWVMWVNDTCTGFISALLLQLLLTVDSGRVSLTGTVWVSYVVGCCSKHHRSAKLTTVKCWKHLGPCGWIQGNCRSLQQEQEVHSVPFFCSVRVC